MKSIFKHLGALITAVFLVMLALVVLAVTPGTTVPNYRAAHAVAVGILLDLKPFIRTLWASYVMRTATVVYAFQTAIATNQGFGVVGELAFDGPTRAQPGVLKGTAAYLVMGRYFTIDTSDGTFVPGGTGPQGGILFNPKSQVSWGTSAGGALAPTLILPAGTVGEFLTMGYPIVALAAAATIGDRVLYDTTTGVLSTVPPLVSVTASIATTVLTVTAVAAGSAPLAVGQVISGANVQPGTTIISLGTGTGGTGTYNLDVSQTAASATVTAAASAPTGTAFVPGDARVVRYTNAAAGLAVISMTGA